MPARLVSAARLSGLVLATAALGGCTTFQTFVTGAAAPVPAGAASAASGAVGPGGASPGLRPPGAPPVAAAPGALRPFADVIKDARRTEAVIAFWQKDDKVWLELRPEDLNQPFFLSSKFKTGIGERGFFGGLMQDSGVIEFRRVHNQMQMIWRNLGYVAKPGTPEAAAIEAGYSPSLVASAPVLSQPDPERKAVLVEANALFLADLLGIGMDLQRSYRQGYAFDPRNSAITKARGSADQLVLEVLGHYATGSIAVPQPGSPPGMPQPSAPRSLPDPRSMFLALHYSLARLPAEPMKGRKSDARIGYFDSGRFDFSNDLERTPRQRFVNRWRLEKKDPAAALSEPVKPIVFWLDRSVPVKYRPAITAGVLEWNKAFEKIGFKDAVQVQIQPDDADFDTLDLNRASIRWMTNASPVFGAIGPSHVDPRSGEILDADIAIESLSSRNIRIARAQVLTGAGVENPFGARPLTSHEQHLLASGRFCNHAEEAGEQMSYALDVLEARGDLDPDSPEARDFVEAYLKEVTMHEVGHTLGLRHNFRSSRAYTLKQVADPAFTRDNGITGSVMDYAPININAPDEPRASYGSPFSTTLGPYDYWAIEFAYRPLPDGLSPAEEKAALERIAGRSAEPQLAYGTDEDNFLGIDPESLQNDLGNDVIGFARKRIAIAQDLLRRQEARQLRPDQDYNLLKRSVSYAIRDVARAANVLSRQIGGVRTVRDAPGTGRDPLAPVPVADQREALDVITGSLLSADSLRVSPTLQRKLATDFSERWEALRGGEGSTQTDYSPSEQVLGLQRSLLAVLMSDTVATRLLESSEKAPVGTGRALRMPELYGRLSQAVWSELDGSGDIAPLRREVQRDHVNRISAMLIRPGASARADTRSTVRAQAKVLLERIRVAGRRNGLSEEARAHLVDSADTLEQAISARLQRSGGLSELLSGGPPSGATAVGPPLPVLRRTGRPPAAGGSIVRPMSSASAVTPVVRPALQSILDAITWRRAIVAALLALVIAALLNPIFAVPFWVLLGRMVFIAGILLLAFAASGAWHPSRMPRWLAQVLAVVIAAPVATLLAYMPSIDGNLTELLHHEGRVRGFIYITAVVLVIAPLFALGAIYREREAQMRATLLGLQLERSTLEREALDTRLRLLQAQIEPHFLFNTLANIQALVESGSPQAAPVLESLIAYLRAAMPRLAAGASTLGNEVALVRSYLELMQMRMPDRLQFSVDVPADIAARAFLPMSLLTLVENAVRHGIDPSEKGGRIDVSARHEADGAIRVIVADSGAGMSPSAVPGTGLGNLESRLRGFFGAAGRLELHDARPHGLSAEIVFPSRLPGESGPTGGPGP